MDLFDLQSFTTKLALGVAAAVGGALAYRWLSARSGPKAKLPAYQTRIVPNSAKGEYGEIHRSLMLGPDDDLVETMPASDGKPISTLRDIFLEGVRVNRNGNCLGTHNGVDAYDWITYGQVEEQVADIAGALHDIGFQRGDFIGIHSINRAEWIIVSQACNRQTFAPVALYDTLGVDATAYIMNKTKLRIVFCTAKTIARQLETAKLVESLQFLVCFDAVTAEQEAEAKAANLTLIAWDDFLARGRAAPVDADEPTPDDVAFLSFTSGTTGVPKGVVLTHRNVVADAAAVSLQLKHYGFTMTTTDVHISYLPLAHVFERVVQEFLLCRGVAIGFFQGDVRKLVDDIGVLKPTIFPSVPRLFNKIYDGVWSKVNGGGFVKKTLFKLAYAAKMSWYFASGSTRHGLWDAIVFNKVKERLGGRVRFMVTGSAPISADVLNFIRLAFCADVYEGYGQTETSAGSTLTLPGDVGLGHVGAPVPCVEVCLRRLGDGEANTSADSGEICFRGPSCFTRYYEEPEKTAEALRNGWVHTGDVGVWTESGTLKIVGRVKHIFKLSQGEYIAPEKLEGVYGKCPLIEQIFVYGDSTRSRLVAAVVPSPVAVAAWKEGADVAAMCQAQDEELKTAIMDQMRAFGKEAKLSGLERISAIHLRAQEFCVEEGTMTPTFKFKRPQVEAVMEDAFAALYATLPE